MALYKLEILRAYMQLQREQQWSTWAWKWHDSATPESESLAVARWQRNITC